MTLVNKDQLDILATLRESVNEDKAGLEADMAKLKDQAKGLSEKNRMQLEQINGLLLEKIGLQGEGIGHREAALRRERDVGWVNASEFFLGLVAEFIGFCSDLRASISGKDLPEDIKSRLLALHEDNIALKEAQKTLNSQLAKARTVSSICASSPQLFCLSSWHSSSKIKINCSKRSTGRRLSGYQRYLTIFAHSNQLY